MQITLEETKSYLRVDSSDEDALIKQLMETAGSLILEVGRLDGDDSDKQEIIRTAEYFAVAYLYEHREDANHGELMATLRCLLAPIRKEVF